MKKKVLIGKYLFVGGNETRSGYVQYVQGIQPNIPACRDSGNDFGRLSVSFLRVGSHINPKRYDGGDTNKK